MTRSILSGLLGLLSVLAVGGLPVACQSGGVGDPCTPEDEYNALFAGFKVTEENIESRSFQCETRICLVNHFQGRVSCPLGQSEPTSCNPDEAGSCPIAGTTCKQASVFAPDCDFEAAKNGTDSCAKGTCKPGGFCGCGTTADCPLDGKWYCDSKDQQCKTYVCIDEARGCQTSDATDNAGKACCIPGTSTPVTTSVCGQCDSKRGRDEAVYCSCRCGVADGEPADPTFNFCDCPTGYACEEIRKNVGLGDPLVTGKYCIKQGTKFVNEGDCQKVLPGGYYNSTECKGAAAPIAPTAPAGSATP